MLLSAPHLPQGRQGLSHFTALDLDEPQFIEVGVEAGEIMPIDPILT